MTSDNAREAIIICARFDDWIECGTWIHVIVFHWEVCNTQRESNTKANIHFFRSLRAHEVRKKISTLKAMISIRSSLFTLAMFTVVAHVAKLMRRYPRYQVSDNRQRCLYFRQSFLQRVPMVIGCLIALSALIHVILTVRFLVEHFVESEEVRDLLTADTMSWQQVNSNWKKKLPRHIHQIWISSIENREMNAAFQKAARTCQDLHPSYEYSLWTHEKLLLWLKTDYIWFVQVYENYRYDMQRIDAMKYFLLYHFGGIYLDLDVKCNVPDLLTAMLPANRTENEPDIIFHMGGEGISANTDIMAAKPYHPLFKLAIHRLKAANRWFYLYHLTIILSAGPTFLYGVYRQYPLKDSIYFIPNDLLWGKLVDGVGGATWYGRDTVLLIFVMEHTFFSCSFLISITVALLCLIKLWKKRRLRS